MIEFQDGEEAKTAHIESLSNDAYAVIFVRVDGVITPPALCKSAESAAHLVAAMSPSETFVSIPEGPARTAMLAALGGDGHSAPPTTLH